jgi:hypothetical protein
LLTSISKPGLDLAVPDGVEVLHRPAAEGAHDHGAHEHGDVGTGDDTHRGDGADDTASHVVEQLSAGVADEQGQQVGDHRADHGCQGFVRQPAGGDEEGGDKAPGDKGADVGHHH